MAYTFSLPLFMIHPNFFFNIVVIMKLKIDHESQVPLHIQAEELLRKLIESPEYIDGKHQRKKNQILKI